MQFTEEVEIWEAEIGAVSLKMKDGVITSRIQIKGRFTPELAQAFGCEDVVYTAKNIARDAFSEVVLDGGCPAFRALLEVQGLQQTIELNGDSVTDISIDRVSDGLLRVKLRLNCSGDPLSLVNYWMLVGGAQGICKISPLQQELAAADDAKVEIHVTKADGTKHIEPVDKRTIRSAMAASKGGQRIQ